MRRPLRLPAICMITSVGLPFQSEQSPEFQQILLSTETNLYTVLFVGNREY